MPFAQLVIGPPGSGKSTYCTGMSQFLTLIERPCSVINLDPANDHTVYKPALDIRDLVTLDEIMEAESLGPNGGILYALEELAHNFDWFEEELKKLKDDYVILDGPGQCEAFTHHSALREVFWRMSKLGYQLIVINLVDSFTVTQPSLYISSLLLCLRSMLQLDLPHLNVLTKIDNLNQHPDLPLPLDFYTDASGLDYLLPHLEEEMSRHPLPSVTDAKAGAGGLVSRNRKGEERVEGTFTKLNEAIIELIEEYSLVSFETLCVEDRDSMRNLLGAIDRASGFAFSAGRDGGVRAEDVWRLAVREPAKIEARDVEERWVTRRDEIDEQQRVIREKELEDLRRREGEGEPGRPGGMDVDEDELDEEELAMLKEARMAGGAGVEVRRTAPST